MTPTKTAPKKATAKKAPAKAPATKPGPSSVPPAGKRVVHANVSDATFDKWQEFAIDNGVSVSGIVEALGTVGPIATGGPITADALVKQARIVDASRRRRGRKG